MKSPALRGALFLVGFACIPAGFALYSLPAGLIALGGISLYLAVR